MPPGWKLLWNEKEKGEAQGLTLTVFLLCVLDLNEVLIITENFSFSLNFIKKELVLAKRIHILLSNEEICPNKTIIPNFVNNHGFSVLN